MVEEGKPAPDFELKTDSGERRQALRLPRQAGRSLLLSQGRHARMHDAGLRRSATPTASSRRRGAVVLGVSADDEKSHVKFKEKYELPFTLLADPERKVAEQYGTWVEKKNYGKEYWGIERSTFLIDSKGDVAKVMRRVKPDTHTDEVLAALPD